jgi:predicted glycogen debranching enzyme
VLTIQKANSTAAFHLSTSDVSIEHLLKKEWLLTNGRGSYSSSTIVGCNTSGYHGLLTGSLDPPLNRIMALSCCLEMIISEGKAVNLSTFEFSNKFAPAGFSYQKAFRQDTGIHFDYKLKKLELSKSVYLLRDTDTIALVYDFSNVRESVEFVVRPFVGLRDFHTLQRSYAPLCLRQLGKGLLIRHDSPNSCRLFLSCPAARFIKDKQWWFNFIYRVNKERGQNHTEDLWTPGFFKCRIDSPSKIVLWANLHSPKERFEHEKLVKTNIDSVCKDLQKHHKEIKYQSKSSKLNFSSTENRDKNLELPEQLRIAADQFIVRRRINKSYSTTILAGYPWFADWGRDAFISLPGLLLCTGRYEQAYSVLTTFAAKADEGMIPSRFDDATNTACFNSIDASLWFVIAAFQYLQESDNSKGFVKELLPTINDIMDSYYKGARFDIHADTDGLITGGSEQTQLTWMDAKYDDIAFTARYGKAVEVNALWYNCLSLLADFYKGQKSEKAEQYKTLANQVKKSFSELFWNGTKEYLNDCILPDGSVDDSLRPNQIFAVSLEYSPLSPEQQKSVVDAVQSKLLTPYGLRTLDPSSDQYKPKYTGPQRERDQAYHQGTVWPYLIGPFIEAYLKVNQFSRESKKQASEFMQPLLRHFNEDACLGSVSEIFDADPPHEPKGCFAQAWSVGELIRVFQLINS